MAGLFPHGPRHTRNAQEIHRKQDFIAQTEALHATISQLEHDLKDVEAYTRDWNSQAVSDTQLANLYGKITQRVHNAGVTPTRFDPQKEIALETLHRAPVQMELTGAYPDICRMLAALEQLPETIWIDHLKIEKLREDGQSVKCDMKLEIFAVNSKKSG